MARQWWKQPIAAAEEAGISPKIEATDTKLMNLMSTVFQACCLRSASEPLYRHIPPELIVNAQAPTGGWRPG
jgi:hypothetical protein